MAESTKNVSYYGIILVIFGCFIVPSIVSRAMYTVPKDKASAYIMDAGRKSGKNVPEDRPLLLPGNAEQPSNMAEARKSLANNEFDKAIDHLTLVIKVDSRNAEAYYLRSLALQKSGEHAKAILDYEAAIRIDPAIAKRTGP